MNTVIMETKDKISKYSFIVMLGHFGVDMCQGALPALLPFLIIEHDLSYTAAATLLLAGNLISAISQPLFGYLGDKVERPWFMCLGMALSAIGLTLVGFFDKYILLCVATFIMGIGTSLFHPEGSKLASIVAGNRKSVGMSIFAVGGNLGFVVGPILVVFIMKLIGLRGTAVFLIPVIIVILLLVPHLKEFTRLSNMRLAQVDEQKNEVKLYDDWKGFLTVSMLMFFKSIVAVSMNTFVPLFFVSVLMRTPFYGSVNIAVFAASGAIATLSGGWIAEKIGVKRIYLICGTALPPLVFLFAFNDSVALATVLIIFIAFAISGAHSVLIVTGQAFLPNRMGMASGVLFGFTVSMGGVVAPIIGNIGDNFGLKIAMVTVACVSLGVMIASYLIPKNKNDVSTEAVNRLVEENSND